MIPGRFLELGIGLEGVRNTPASSPDKWVKHVNADIVPRAEKVVDDNVRGRLEDSEGSRVAKLWFDGDLGGILHVDVLGYLLMNVYGEVNTTTVSGSVKDHAFTVLNDNEHPTLTVFRKDEDIEQQKYAGGIVNTLEITGSVDDYLRFTANLIAKSESSDASTPSYDTEYDFITRDVVIKTASTEGGLSGATAIKGKEFAIRWDMAGLSDFVFGSRNPDSNYQQHMMIEVDITKNYVDTTFEDLFKADTTQYVQITITGEANIGGGNNPTITLLLNKAQVMEWERSGGQDDPVEESFTLRGFLNQTDDQQSEITLRNLTATYEVGS